MSACSQGHFHACWVCGSICDRGVFGPASEESASPGVVAEDAPIPFLSGNWCCPFDSHSDGLQELLDNRTDVKFCISNDVLLMKQTVNVVDLDSLLCSDCLGLSRLALLKVVLLCFRSNFQKQFEPTINDYAMSVEILQNLPFSTGVCKVKTVSQLRSINICSSALISP